MCQRIQYLNCLKYIYRKPFQSKDSPFLFSHARTALKYGLKAYNIQRGVEILIPEYICDVVLHPLYELGITPIYYCLNDRLEADWNDIKNKFNSNTAAVLVVHYFGFPQNISEYINFTSANDILLIEDNAHGFGAKFKNQLLGTFGDIGIASPRKSFPIFNGAYLYLDNNKQIMQIDCLPLQPLNVVQKQIKEIAKKIIKKSEMLRFFFLNAPNYNNIEEFSEEEIPEWSIDESSYCYMLKQNIDVSSRIRRELCKVWEKWALSNDLIPVYPSDDFPFFEEAAPLIFPAYTPSEEDRNKWFEWGFKVGIDVHSWPTLPKDVINCNYSAFLYWKKLICFPIHPRMNPLILQMRLSTLNGIR